MKKSALTVNVKNESFLKPKHCTLPWAAGMIYVLQGLKIVGSNKDNIPTCILGARSCILEHWFTITQP